MENVDLQALKQELEALGYVSYPLIRFEDPELEKENQIKETWFHIRKDKFDSVFKK